MKRILLVNFHDSPENMHFELALERAVRKTKGLALDVLHDFDVNYGFLGESRPPGGKRLKLSGPETVDQVCRGNGIRMVLLDFPKRARSAAAFIRLALKIPAYRKIFVANHLLPYPGQNFTADLARRVKALSRVDAWSVLAADDIKRCEEMGISRAHMTLREYSSDCVYYSPVKVPVGDYVFSAGSAGRDFSALYEGVKGSGLGLKIFSDSKPENMPAWVDYQPLSKNLHELKQAVAAARAVVIPLRDDYKNGSAGNSIIFLSMALGRPVLTRQTKYMAAYIKDGQSGFFYPSLSSEAIASGLRRIKSLSPVKLKKLGASARRSVLRKASLDRFCRELLLSLA